MAKLSGMQLVFHGGLCCGIKTVYQMGVGQNALIDTSPVLVAVSRDDRDQSGGEVTSSTRFFHEAAPKETNLERLDRYIAYMKKRRPKNILEVVIALSPRYPWSDQSVWIPALLERGFKEVNRHKNSNSGNTVVVFHLNIDEYYPGCEDDEAIDEDDECDDDCECCDHDW